MRTILFGVNPDSNLCEENLKANVFSSQNYKNAINLICTKLIKDI